MSASAATEMLGLDFLHLSQLSCLVREHHFCNIGTTFARRKLRRMSHQLTWVKDHHLFAPWEQVLSPAGQLELPRFSHANLSPTT
jgi:hypothetical protein